MPDTKHIPLNLTIWKSWSPNLPHFLWFKQKEQWTRKLHFWKAFYKWMLTRVLLLIWIFVRNKNIFFAFLRLVFDIYFKPPCLLLHWKIWLWTMNMHSKPISLLLGRACGAPPPQAVYIDSEPPISELIPKTTN